MVRISGLVNKGYKQYAVIPDVVNYIGNKIQPIMIVLFGSCAKGIITNHSDIDLCIVIEEEMTPKDRVRLRGILLLDVLQITDYEVDVFICSLKEWKEKHKDQGTFIGKIFKEGKIIYGRQ